MELHALAGAYVIDRQLLGMQGLARKVIQDRILAGSWRRAWPFAAIDFIADQWKAHVGEMDAQLMGAAGAWQQSY